MLLAFHPIEASFIKDGYLPLKNVSIRILNKPGDLIQCKKQPLVQAVSGALKPHLSTKINSFKSFLSQEHHELVNLLSMPKSHQYNLLLLFIHLIDKPVFPFYSDRPIRIEFIF